MAGTLEGLQALVSEKGHKHSEWNELLDSSEQGCPFCTLIAERCRAFGRIGDISFGAPYKEGENPAGISYDAHPFREYPVSSIEFNFNYAGIAMPGFRRYTCEGKVNSSILYKLINRCDR
jgi:hypothetical protein